MEETCIALHLINNIIIIVIINGARSILRIRCAMAGVRLPGPFVRFITHCVILARKYTHTKKVYRYMYIYLYT